MVKNLTAMRETQVNAWVMKTPLEKGMATWSCLENPRDRGVSQVTLHGVMKSQTRLSS